jgi:dTDP-4-dehydrorhamnose reductase
MKILIIGNGYVGTRCSESWDDSILVGKRVTKLEDVLEFIDEHKPDAVLNAAGKTGKPNVDWCETHQMETIMGNTHLPILIAQACAMRNVYLLHIGSGCIFYGASPDPKGWKEEDFGNPTAVYSRAKYAADLVLSTLPNVGIARIRMPMDDIPSERNIIDKLAKYSRIIDVENSLTVIPDMVKVFHQLMEKKAEGIFHVTNPGTVKHREIVELYKEMVDPNKTCEWISEDELVTDGLASKKRSTNTLQSNNLRNFGIEMRDAKEALRDIMKKYAELKKKK